MNDPASVALALEALRGAARELEAKVGQVVIGQQRAVRLITICIFARGHVLLAGDVGVGKTTLLRAVGRAIGGGYERVEGTVDMMPADLLYHTYIADDGRPRIEPSAILEKAGDLSILFFNEINRARPQVHSLLLRLMAERSVAAFKRTYDFPHLQVYADRNRVEKEETFELPAAARDRFFMEIPVEAPADPETRRRLIFDPRYRDVDLLLQTINEPALDHRVLSASAGIIQESVHASEAVQNYVLRLWDAIVHPATAGITLASIDMIRLVQGGGSPRGLAFLVRAARVRAWLEGRDMLVPEDVRDVFVETVAHRIFLDPVYELRREQIVGDLCAAVLASVAAP
ncbi:AAA family ATPase [Bradyrhizobium sp. SK17]|jgi:MoxR-like ATPase|uniref:AAA family ATPase n=1 Tax=Bradyrhizobium sp. SK17 TaxID=2057741 RepID=UPI000C313BC9|nr:MoxR family ATPase [Bradyrhizobium sp. SK17]AUC95609.1 AAA family ATPase [Bradyrhizobium sp. SK17]